MNCPSRLVLMVKIARLLKIFPFTVYETSFFDFGHFEDRDKNAELLNVIQIGI
jgi:hypothetical protein